MLKILSRQVAPLTTCKAANAQQSGTVIIGDGGGEVCVLRLLLLLQPVSTLLSMRQQLAVAKK